MKIEKSHFDVQGPNLHLNVPFSKVNKEERLVSGYATLDNVDRQGDVVTAEASKDAFSRARGNIREMHGTSAVGRMVDFREDNFYDTDTEKFYTGIYVTAYISKGAQDAWEKVLDGTYSGFSIGGNITDAETQWVKDAGANVRFVKSYDLIELSLVDNPANQFANVFSIQKSDTGTMVKGMIADVTLENIFYCEQDEKVNLYPEESATCVKCGDPMVNIGWWESSEDKDAKVREVVSKFLDTKVEGGVDMTKKNEVEVEKVIISDDVNGGGKDEKPKDDDEKVAEVDETEGADGKPEEVEVEKADEVDETPEVNLEKMLADLTENFKKSLEKTHEVTEEAVSKIEEQIAEINKSFESKVSEIEAQFTELGSKLDGMKTSSDEVAKRLETLEDATAIRKSGEVEAPEVKKNSSLFKGVFLSTNDLD